MLIKNYCKLQVQSVCPAIIIRRPSSDAGFRYAGLYLLEVARPRLVWRVVQASAMIAKGKAPKTMTRKRPVSLAQHAWHSSDSSDRRSARGENESMDFSEVLEVAHARRRRGR